MISWRAIGTDYYPYFKQLYEVMEKLHPDYWDKKGRVIDKEWANFVALSVIYMAGYINGARDQKQKWRKKHGET